MNTYEVHVNDTPQSIALRHDVPVEELIQVNPRIATELIVGELIDIPPKRLYPGTYRGRGCPPGFRPVQIDGETWDCAPLGFAGMRDCQGYYPPTQLPDGTWTCSPAGSAGLSGVSTTSSTNPWLVGGLSLLAGFGLAYVVRKVL